MYMYLVGASLFMLAWMILYVAAARARHAMLCASLGLAHLGPLLQNWYLTDYWHPEYVWSTRIAGAVVGLEDYLFGFGITGLAAGLFQVRSRGRSGAWSVQPLRRTWVRLQVVGGLFVLFLFLLTGLLGINSVHATLIACAAGSIWMFGKAAHWLPSALFAGCGMTLLLWIFYELVLLPLYPNLFDEWWRPSALTGLKLGRVPIEELAWAFAMGVFVAPLVAVCATPLTHAAKHGRPQPPGLE
jgi:hypothetical protein